MTQSDRPVVDLPAAARTEGGALHRIVEALRGLRFGTVVVTVQDGVVIQIDRTDKTRLDKADR